MKQKVRIVEGEDGTYYHRADTGEVSGALVMELMAYIDPHTGRVGLKIFTSDVDLCIRNVPPKREAETGRQIIADVFGSVYNPEGYGR